MRVIDCTLGVLNRDDLKNFDLVVVGLGVAGSIITALSNSKKRILIVESGKENFDSKLQKLNDILVEGLPIRDNFCNRIRQVGGTSNLWPGRCMQLSSIDFEERNWIPDSGWPIDYDELISGYNKSKAFFDFPGFDPYDIDNASIDVLFQNIKCHDYYKFPEIKWSKVVPRFGVKSSAFKKLKKAENLTLLLGATVKKFIVKSGRVEACEICADSGTYNVIGSKYVLATGGIENARVLLETKECAQATNFDPFDNVGAFYMDHPTAVSTVIPLATPVEDSRLFTRVSSHGKSKIGISFSDVAQKKYGVTNAYLEINPKYSNEVEFAFANFIESYSAIRTGKIGRLLKLMRGSKLTELPEAIYLLAPKEIIPHGFLYAYAMLRKLLKANSTVNNIVISHHLEQTPLKASKISLSPRNGMFGIRTPVLNWVVADNDIRSASLLEELVLQDLKKSGLVTLTERVTDFKKLNDASHHMGTTRMSKDSVNGVVDTNCKVHSIDNLYVSGSSVFPTGGSANPTLTIAALAIRLAEYLNNDQS